LTLLALTGNQLKGSIPASLTRLTDLKALAIDDNLLTGHVRALRSLTKLKYLYLARNGFEELIDESFLSNNTQLIVLDMSNNAFVGKVPSSSYEYEQFIGFGRE
jgi:Leucine-rich repeat (LRR) protein